MKISADSHYLHPSPRPQKSVAANGTSTSFSSVLTSTTAGKTGVAQADFTSMTRQEMFDWMNGQIRDGKMSLDESSAFLGMTIKISVATGQPVDMAGDTERINFVEKARSGIEGALSRNELTLARKLQVALDTMYQHHGQLAGAGARA